MNAKTQLQAEYNPEYMDIARYRLEQERNPGGGGGGLDRRNYELLPSTLSKYGVTNNNDIHTSSKLAGIPMVATNPTPSQFVTAPIGNRPPAGRNSPGRVTFADDAGGGDNSNNNNNNRSHIPIRTSKVPSFAVPPAPKSHSRPELASQDDIRRQLDRLKLDTQEAVAQFRNAAPIKNLF